MQRVFRSRGCYPRSWQPTLIDRSALGPDKSLKLVVKVQTALPEPRAWQLLVSISATLRLPFRKHHHPLSCFSTRSAGVSRYANNLMRSIKLDKPSPSWLLESKINILQLIAPFSCQSKVRLSTKQDRMVCMARVWIRTKSRVGFIGCLFQSSSMRVTWIAPFASSPKNKKSLKCQDL
jgi:hypothetical protein